MYKGIICCNEMNGMVLFVIVLIELAYVMLNDII